MASPIKETPILYGEEARKFEMRMLNPPPNFSRKKRTNHARLRISSWQRRQLQFLRYPTALLRFKTTINN